MTCEHCGLAGGPRECAQISLVRPRKGYVYSVMVVCVAENKVKVWRRAHRTNGERLARQGHGVALRTKNPLSGLSA